MARACGCGRSMRTTSGATTLSAPSRTMARTLRLLTLIDEYTRKCLAIRVARRLNSYDLIETLADLMLVHGVPEHMRSDNGPEFVARKTAEVAVGGGSQDAVHRAGQSLGERLL